MFTIYRGEEIIFIPETSIVAMRYNKEQQTVTISHGGLKEVIRNVDAVNYASKAFPFTLKYVNR